MYGVMYYFKMWKNVISLSDKLLDIMKYCARHCSVLRLLLLYVDSEVKNKDKTRGKMNLEQDKNIHAKD